MKKYWNKLVLAAVSLTLIGAASCSDDGDTSDMPPYFFQDFAYLEYYPDTNTAPTTSASYDYRGVILKKDFAKFRLKLTKAVESDTKIVLGTDPDKITGNYESVPEEDVAFSMLDSEGNPVEGDIVIPAGQTMVYVVPKLTSTEFALETQMAASYMLPVVIKSIDQHGLDIPADKNLVNYPIDVPAYTPDFVSILSKNNTSVTMIEGLLTSSGVTLSTMDFGDINITLDIPYSKDITVTLALDPTANVEGTTAIPESAITLSSKQVSLRAGETSAKITAKLNDSSFIGGKAGKFVLPLIIKEVSAKDDLFIKFDKKQVDLTVKVAAYAFAAPTEGTRVTNRTAYSGYYMKDGEATQKNINVLFDGKGSEIWPANTVIGFIDLGAVTTITGIQMVNYSASYAMKDVDYYVSDDFTNWTLVHEVTGYPVLKTQELSFLPITTRYIKFDAKNCSEPSAGLDMVEMYFYVK